MQKCTPAPSDCDPQAFALAQDIVLNPTMGKTTEELETAQALYKLYNSLRYGFKTLLTNFINDRQYMAVRDQLPRRSDENAPSAMAEYKEARRRMIYAPVKAAVEAYMEQNLQAAGTEAEFLKNFGANSEQTIRALIERLLDLAVERYWVEVQLNPDTEKRQPEIIKVKLEDGRPVEVSEQEQRKHMRQCLLRLNQQELEARQRQFGNRSNTHKESHIDTVMARGGPVAQPGASNFVVTEQSGVGQYCVLLLDFNTSEWECLARLRNQQSSFTYADEQRKAAPQGVLIRAFRDAQNEFPLGTVGALQDIDCKWRKPLQIPHLQAREGQAPVLVSFMDTKRIEGTWYMNALTEMLEEYKVQFHRKSEATVTIAE
ncbi:hypothetical protein H6F86_31125 [Phormidium sp. FACHB-592]|uniref:Uncharacterized protein n=1 Tax=Stenomitos frigidus AS-A4 TaxID=2933935 RepID=A0ABV0KSV0_9CYAN|nr:hypothetical protein [Phormidium sp. FACHB-592]MBD2078264.1 hypothetical protein [Phormidium sp. FACHB-592]